MYVCIYICDIMGYIFLSLAELFGGKPKDGDSPQYSIAV